MSDPTSNGEALFFHNFAEKHCRIVFDIGAKSDSVFTDFNGEVHYFNPVSSDMTKLSKSRTKNERSVFNRFGILDINGEADFFPDYSSFVDHYKSLDTFPSEHTILHRTMRGDTYMKEHDVKKIDMLKIRAKGCEFKVLESFGKELRNIHIIQFEYGPHFYDADVKLEQVIGYLSQRGFYNFSYLTPTTLLDVTSLEDFYERRRIVCLNQHFSK